MLGFKVGNQLIDIIGSMGAEHSDRWRHGFLIGLSSWNYTIARAFADAYGLSCPVVSNNSQRARCQMILDYLLRDEPEELAGFLQAWLTAGTREDMMQVVTGEGEGGPAADGSVRVAIAKFLQGVR